MNEKEYVKEAKDYISGNASSWYVRDVYIGTNKSISMTFLNFVYKIHANDGGILSTDADLVTEAMATITLESEAAKAFALAILARVESNPHNVK